MRPRISIALMFLFLLNQSAWGQVLRLGTAVHPPYQIKSEAGVQGSVVDTVKCVLNNMMVPYEIAVYPWKRNFNYLKAGKLDLIFSLQGNSHLDQYAVLTGPLAVEKWYWYGMSELQALNSDTQIGVVAGSSQEAWLHEHGFNAVTSVNSLASLVKMAHYERVKAILVDEQALARHANSNKLDLSLLQKRFYRFSIFAAYVAKHYLVNNSGFVEIFNEGIFRCNPPDIELSEKDRAAILHLRAEIEAWFLERAVIEALLESNQKHKDIKVEDIKVLDQRWRSQLKNDDRPLINRIMEHPISIHLKQVKQNSGGLVTEIILIDRKGLNVALSDETSDYWQGDEDKFQKTFVENREQPHIGELVYDESSRSFQSQISIVIRDPESAEAIGVITVGVDVGKALSYRSR